MKYCVSVTHLSTGEVEPELILSVSENKKKTDELPFNTRE